MCEREMMRVSHAGCVRLDRTALFLPQLTVSHSAACCIHVLGRTRVHRVHACRVKNQQFAILIKSSTGTCSAEHL